MPNKFGWKFWVLVEVQNKSVANILPYLAIQEKMQSKNFLQINMWLATNQTVETMLCEISVIF